MHPWDTLTSMFRPGILIEPGKGLVAPEVVVETASQDNWVCEKRAMLE